MCFGIVILRRISARRGANQIMENDRNRTSGMKYNTTSLRMRFRKNETPSSIAHRHNHTPTYTHSHDIYRYVYKPTSADNGRLRSLYSRGRGGANKNHAKPPWEPARARLSVYIGFIKGFVPPHPRPIRPSPALAHTHTHTIFSDVYTGGFCTAFVSYIVHV